MAGVASFVGDHRDFLAALKEMNEMLPRKPREWGCPLRAYRGMKATLYRYYGPVIMAYYAVHDEKPIVFVSDVIPTLGTLLSDIYRHHIKPDEK